MAHFPRWIDDSTVDSAAMLGAFLHYKGSTSGEEREALNQLWTVEHQSCPVIHIGGQAVMPREVNPPDLLQRQCTRANCVRCESKRGGYEFRWYDARWYPCYLGTMREGAWKLQCSAS